ncbi:MAG: TIGR04283 family arsenosugar biosynthesis glycosyltransferase [Hyphomicrobiales bacterium]
MPNTETAHQPNALTVVIPTYNAAHSLGKTLDCVATIRNIIVSDGGSSDATRDIAKTHGASVIQKAKGRGAQLKAGSEAATTDWLLFLHADTFLDQQALDAVFQFINAFENQQRAAYFRFKLDDDSPQATKLEEIVAWRCRKHALPYGDQGLLIRRDFLNALGGYKAIPIMEDVELVRRITKSHGETALINLEADAVTSADKFLRDGYKWRSTKNLFYLFLFWLKVPPRIIAKLY